MGYLQEGLIPLSSETHSGEDVPVYATGARAAMVHGTIERDVGSQTITFEMTDGTTSYPVVYRGLAPDTFTDDVDVVVEGRLDPDGTFRATTLLAKCGSRYETVPEA